MTRGIVLLGVVLLSLLVAGAPGARAQLYGGDSSAGRPMDDNGLRNAGNRNGPKAAAPKPVLAPIPQVVDPWQRLDRGALLCGTEADLEQHQAAVAGRLEGHPVPEPTGCHIITQMIAVSVVTRHGLAKTEVSLPASLGQKTGWTDAAIPKDKPLAP